MKKNFIYRFKYLLIFAFILIMLALDYVIYKKVLNRQVENVLVQHYAVIDNNSYHRKSVTVFGDITAILNANSSLKIPKDSLAPKNIVLDGDAFFRIPQGQQDSVFVYTRMLKIGTKGAEFRITAHKEHAGQTLEMLYGKSVVYKAYSSSFADPEFPIAGNMIMINKDIDLMEKEKFDTTKLKVWLADSLTFENDNFSEAIKKLEDWFDVDVDVSGPFSSGLNLSERFHRVGLKAILDTLSKKSKFSYTLHGTTVNIQF